MWQFRQTCLIHPLILTNQSYKQLEFYPLKSDASSSNFRYPIFSKLNKKQFESHKITPSQKNKTIQKKTLSSPFQKRPWPAKNPKIQQLEIKSKSLFWNINKKTKTCNKGKQLGEGSKPLWNPQSRVKLLALTWSLRLQSRVRMPPPSLTWWGGIKINSRWWKRPTCPNLEDFTKL